MMVRYLESCYVSVVYCCDREEGMGYYWKLKSG